MTDYYENEIHKNTYHVLERDGVHGLKEYIADNLEKWKKVHVHIAVTGNSGAGKSSFINAMRGIYQSEKNVAKEGTTETTKDIVPYSHPDNESIHLWDLPGMGTMAMPAETYDGQIGFDKFDFFVIVCSN
ncbi:interferon-inducible GTPase 1-like [Mercenaria mercenaria]|uniref:interferon-inducible GTPase 1-like n=1 Tax=Mercenaria mercenaria TaxID=6596 RepID=UPI00234F4C78|nr:interferon-inducible GTPase 1-like [Mercenaria mercenaria]